MLSFTSLPTELQLKCLQQLDIATLKSCRLASRDLARAGEAYLFQTVVLHFNEKSAEKFGCIVQHEHLKDHVKSILIDATEGAQNNEAGSSDASPDEDEAQGSPLHHPDFNTMPWTTAIAQLARFPVLSQVQLRFDAKCVYEPRLFGNPRQGLAYRARYQKLFFAALADAPHVTDLTLHNWQDAILDVDVARDRIQRLAVLIVTELDDTSPEHSILLPALHAGFRRLPEALGRAGDQLTHLTLFADAPWGVWPFADVRRLRFPRLASLALGNWTVAHDWQVEWVLSHGASLEELVLDDVAIAHALWMCPEMAAANNWGHAEETPPGAEIFRQYATRWSDVLPLFGERLARLKHFAMGHGVWRRGRMFEERYKLPARIEASRYITYYDGGAPCQWGGVAEEGDEHVDENGVVIKMDIPGEEQDRRDAEALDALLRKIETASRRA